MGDFLRTILDSIHFLWPLAIVNQYEVGIYLVFGRVWKVVQPGLYPVVPWFITIHPMSMAWEPAHTGRCDVTTKSGDTLTFETKLLFRVIEAVAAYTLLHDYEHGIAQVAAMELSEKLAEVEPERFEPEKRRRLNTSCQSWVTQRASRYGLEVESVSFTTFILKPRTYRLLSDTGSVL